jgi:hypothetical protein
MKRMRWLLSVIALIAGGALLWEAESLKTDGMNPDLAPPRRRDAQLRHGQFIATGWSLLFVSGVGLWLHYRCPVCRKRTREETPSC